MKPIGEVRSGLELWMMKLAFPMGREPDVLSIVDLVALGESQSSDQGNLPLVYIAAFRHRIVERCVVTSRWICYKSTLRRRSPHMNVDG
jgi:hypothetical protein